MFVEQDTGLAAKPVEVKHDKPRKTAASIVLLLVFILAFLCFLNLSHLKLPVLTLLPISRAWGIWADVAIARVLPSEVGVLLSKQ